MPRRPATFASAVSVGILASLSLVTMARGETATAETCLAAPKGETPQGSHWYYRIDRASKRNCWYLRREIGGMPQATVQNSAPAQAPSPKPSVVDAHAEFRAQPTREDNPVVSQTANAASSDPWPAPLPAEKPTATVATRWPDPQLATATANAGTVVADATPVASAPLGATTPPVVASPPSQAPAATAPATPSADSAVSVRPETIQTLIAGALGALACAGIAAFISRRRRIRSLRREEARGPAWETTGDDRIILSDHRAANNRNYQPRFARDIGYATAAPVNRAPRPAMRRSGPAPR